MSNPSNSKNNLGAEDRLGFALAARLNEAVEDVSPSVSERLRHAREQAIKQQAIMAKVVSVQRNGTLTMSSTDTTPWKKFAMYIPLLALAAGLIAIDAIQDEIRAKEIAEVDYQILTDELPPGAYTDPGFAHYLKTLQEAK